MRKVLIRCVATLAVYTGLLPIVVAQNAHDLFRERSQLPPQILERLGKDPEQEPTEAKSAEAAWRPGEINSGKSNSGEAATEERDDNDQKLDDFFDELEELVRGNDARSNTIKAMMDEYAREYKDLERQLTGSPTDTSRLDRQKIIVQYHQNLSSRSLGGDRSQMHEVLSAMSERIRTFRRENPQLAQQEEFRDRERAIRNRAMQANQFGRHPSRNLISMKETMIKLSAAGEVVDHWAPTCLRAHPGEQKGALQNAHFTLRRMLRLRWDGDRLSLDRNHWNHAFAGQFPQDIQADVDHLLEKRGIEPYANENERQQVLRMAQRGVLRGADSSPLANLGRLFHEFYATGSRSYSGGGTTGRWTAQSDDVYVRLDADLAKLTLSFEELSHPGRVIRIHAVGPTLQITVLGDFIHRFQQQVDSNGNSSLRVTEILDDEVLNYQVASFAELYRQQPRYVEDRFLPLLEHLGIVPPLSRFDPQLTQRVIELLTGDRAKIQAEFDVIAQELDVDQFTRRESAFRKLRDDLDKFFPFIYAKSKDTSISRETRARISKLLEIGNEKGTSELDSTIAALGLTNDTHYLTELAKAVAPEQGVIVESHLKTLGSF